MQNLLKFSRSPEVLRTRSFYALLLQEYHTSISCIFHTQAFLSNQEALKAVPNYQTRRLCKLFPTTTPDAASTSWISVPYVHSVLWSYVIFFPSFCLHKYHYPPTILHNSCHSFCLDKSFTDQIFYSGM